MSDSGPTSTDTGSSAGPAPTASSFGLLGRLLRNDTVMLLVSHWIVVVGALLSVIPLIPVGVRAPAYKLALISSIFSGIKQHLNRFGFTFSKQYFAQLLNSADIQAAVTSLAFYFGSPFVMWTVPLAIRSAFYLAKSPLPSLPVFQIPAVINFHAHLNQPHTYERGMLLKAQLEAALVLPLIVDAFTGGRSLIGTLVFIQIQRLRYFTSKYTKAVWDSVGAFITRVTSHALFPAPLRFVIDKIRAYLVWVPQRRS